MTGQRIAENVFCAFEIDDSRLKDLNFIDYLWKDNADMSNAEKNCWFVSEFQSKIKLDIEGLCLVLFYERLHTSYSMASIKDHCQIPYGKSFNPPRVLPSSTTVSYMEWMLYARPHEELRNGDEAEDNYLEEIHSEIFFWMTSFATHLGATEPSNAWHRLC